MSRNPNLVNQEVLKEISEKDNYTTKQKYGNFGSFDWGSYTEYKHPIREEAKDRLKRMN